MDGQILALDPIVAQARTSAQLSQDIYVPNPHPAGTEAHDLWLISFEIALREREAACV